MATRPPKRRAGVIPSRLCSGATNTSARCRGELPTRVSTCQSCQPRTPDTSNDSRDPQVTLWMTVRIRKWEPARTAPVFYGSGHMPFPVGTGLRPVQKGSQGLE